MRSSNQHTGDFRNLAALWIAAIYTLSAFVWVLASNWFLASQVRESDILPHGNTAATLTQLQNIKGWLSALISAWLLYFVVGQLVGAIKKAEKRAQDTERWFGSAFDSNPRPMWIYDLETLLFLAVNDAAVRHYGYSREEFLGMTINDVSPAENVPEQFIEVLEANNGASASELRRHQKKDGAVIFVELASNPIQFAGRKAALVLATDITEHKQAEQILAYLAQYDSLTGLPNRNLFRDRLSQAITRSQRSQKPVALMFLDLDRFKEINDALGHKAGDSLLKRVSERLSGCVRVTDTIARLGGDEFTAILEEQTSVEHIAAVAQKILNAFSQPVVVDNHEIFVTLSLGITVYPSDANDADNMIKQADAAMYHAKNRGRNNYQFYSDAINPANDERLSMENRLRRALEREEFLLHYQPQMDLQSGEIVGVEALLRWQNPELGGLVSPAQFIPLAEETGLIAPIGEWVLKTACKQNKAWQDAGLPPMRIAVNLSARQFSRSSLTKTISDALKDSGLPGAHLELEITEGLLMENKEASNSILADLKEMGVHVSIDDFGTGYSSLSYLKHFPIDVLKIDQSFVRDIPMDSNDAAIATAIIALAHSLELKVIAEGVETKEQLAFLRAQGCDCAQGHYFSRPVPADELLELLRKGKASQGKAPD